MNFYAYGPFDLNRDHRGLVLVDRDARREFWQRADMDDPGLSEACGCYVFAVANGPVPKPWYVGKAERQTFRSECLTDHKLSHYNSVLKSVGKGRPVLYFYARITSERMSYCRPTSSGYRDIAYLEKMLIGHALRKNKNLVNRQETKLLREMHVPGLINPKPGQLTRAAKELKGVLGL